MQLKNRNGFTLIEVLIVVLIISILSGVALSLLNSGGYRQKARDSQRVSDLRKVQTALELYFQDNRQYPTSTSYATISSALSGSLVPNYISVLPDDPTAASGSNAPCTDYGGNSYYYAYRTSAANDRYVLLAHMETSTASSSACGSLSNWSALGCGSVSSCYGVQNP